MAPRIMYLHGMKGLTESDRFESIKIAAKNDFLIAPNLRTKEFILIFSLTFGVLSVSGICFAIYWIIFHDNVLSKVLPMIIWAIIVKLTYSLGGRLSTYYMLKTAVSIAETKCVEEKINVIIGSSFGSVVALLMNVPKVSLILLAPAQYVLGRYLHMRKIPSLDYYPYVILVHGDNDSTVSLDDSIHFVEDNLFANCKLEVIADSHSLSTLSSVDFREFIDEAYTKGKAFVNKLTQQEIEQLATTSKSGMKQHIIDRSLFDLEPFKQSSDIRVVNIDETAEEAK